MKDLEDRMKGYEKKYELPINIPVVIRIDGRAFHTFTRGMVKPFDDLFIDMMNNIGIKLCDEIQNCRLAYLQSDEISFLVYNRIESDSWFSNEIQKMCSISASLASSVATKYTQEIFPNKTKFTIAFDSRAYIIPEKDVVNYFIYRQKDWERNSLQMYTRGFYSQKQIQNKNCQDMHEMLHIKGMNWNDLPVYLKRGRCIVKVVEEIEINNDYFKGNVVRSRWTLDNEIPIFKENRNYILDRMVDTEVISNGGYQN